MKKSMFVIHNSQRLEFDPASHTPITFKMPEDLPRWQWPCMPALRRTRLEFLNVAQCRALMVHTHGEEFAPDHLKARRDYWWWRMCEAIGSPNVSGISAERAAECLRIDNTTAFASP